MTDTGDTQLIIDLSRDLLAQVAPQELPLFRAASQAYQSDPDALSKSGGEKDEMLGFGAGEVAALLTPAVLLITSEVVKFLAEEV